MARANPFLIAIYVLCAGAVAFFLGSSMTGFAISNQASTAPLNISIYAVSFALIITIGLFTVVARKN